MLLEHPYKTLRSNQESIVSLEKVTSTNKNENKGVFLQMAHRLACLFSRTSKTLKIKHGDYCDGTRNIHS